MSKKPMSESILVQHKSNHCTLSIESPAPGVVVLCISGRDVGEFGLAPMHQLGKYLSNHPLTELYIDARRTKGASIEVSSDWAMWLSKHRSHFKHISMLTGSRFIQITAGFVRSFADLENIMRLYTDPEAFDEALAFSVADAKDG